jgi:Tfp pilus assembly protein PilW
MSRFTRLRDAGFTPVEAMIVMLLAGVVMLGLFTFYFSSQASWLDASSQALAQRDATIIIQHLARNTRQAAAVSLTNCPGQVVLYSDPGGTAPFKNFFWNMGDSLIHFGNGATCSSDQGPVVSSLVEEFNLTISGSPPVLKLVNLRVRSATGERIEMSSSFALYNAP